MIGLGHKNWGSSEPAPAKVSSSDEQFGGPFSELTFTSAGDRRKIGSIKQ